jgi:two-component sensor histidine kinase
MQEVMAMVALQIRDVPDEVRDTLVAQARQRGQSLQAYLLDLVRQQARRANNAALLDRFSGRDDGIRTAPGELAAHVAEQRRAREQDLSA